MGNNKIEMKQICIVTIFTLTFIFFNSLTAIAASEPGYKSIYIGQETRDIKSLSNEDINALRTGAGWGLAKAAELNGLPGPRHILDMKKEINLTTEQERMVRGLFNEMNKKAIELGNKYIEYEKELNNRFAERNIDENA